VGRERISDLFSFGHMLPDELAAIATGRTTDLFAVDVETHRQALTEQIRGARILVIGGAGSIGAATVEAIVPFQPCCLHVVDHNENSLAELVRNLRSGAIGMHHLQDFRAHPLNFASPVFGRFLQQAPSYDYVLNFAALKHVRSEKDVYSVLQLLDTNVVKQAGLLKLLSRHAGLKLYFSVSTDKAANPVNLMGASKRLMEHVMFSGEVGVFPEGRITSARFANVAFSNGSLLQSWLIRLDKRQPLAVPRDTRRFFISLRESRQICLLAAFIAPHNHLLFPRLDSQRDLHELADLAGRVLQHFQYTPRLCTKEEEARQAMKENGKLYPLLLTALNTSGEKAYEEFLGQDERSVELGMRHVLGVRYRTIAPGLLQNFLRYAEAWIENPAIRVEIAQIVREIEKVIPEFNHALSPRSLDHRM
jgi:FlaA1/EpsC-like NDP-sugar epimerase